MVVRNEREPQQRAFFPLERPVAPPCGGPLDPG
jgi:hypothetical protein